MEKQHQTDKSTRCIETVHRLKDSYSYCGQENIMKTSYQAGKK